MSGINCLIIFPSIILALTFLIYYSFDTSYQIIEITNTKAKCLDGSNYKFSFSPGFGNGTKSFMVYFESGGWCGDYNYDPYDDEVTLESCLWRSHETLGTNKFELYNIFFNKFAQRYFTSSKYFNPIFYNWNKVFIKYCDGTIHIGNEIY